MDTIDVNLVTVETIDSPLKVTISRNMSLKALISMAERLLSIEIYSLYVNDKRLTDISQLNHNDVILALNGLSPQPQTLSFFRPSENYESYISNSDSNSIEIKVVVLGPQGAGKTSLILRFVLGFFKTNNNRTLLEAEYEKNLQVGGQNVTMSILDTAGDHEDEKTNQKWMNNRNAYILALGIDQLDEWPVILHYHKTIRKYVRNPIIFVLITKIDLNEKMSKYQKSDIQLKLAQIEGFCKDQHLLLFKTSAKVNKKVHEMFITVASRCVNPEKHFDEHEDYDREKVPFLFKVMNKVLAVSSLCMKRLDSVI